jgi:hypothetical protein
MTQRPIFLPEYMTDLLNCYAGKEGILSGDIIRKAVLKALVEYIELVDSTGEVGSHTPVLPPFDADEDDKRARALYSRYAELAATGHFLQSVKLTVES